MLCQGKVALSSTSDWRFGMVVLQCKYGRCSRTCGKEFMAHSLTMCAAACDLN